MLVKRLTASLELRLLKKHINDFLRERGYDPLQFNIEAMISPAQFFYGMIRQEHTELQKEGNKEVEIYAVLSARYGYKIETIKKIVLGKR